MMSQITIAHLQSLIVLFDQKKSILITLDIVYPITSMLNTQN